jgi:CRISPR locus-related DNA-binding protein
LKLYIATVGFDEKLVLRALLPLGLKDGDTVIAVTVRSGGEREQRMVAQALENLRQVVAGVGARFVAVELSGEDLAGDLAKLVSTLRGYASGSTEVTAALAGGMRILLPIVVTSLLLLWAYAGARVRFVFIREDGFYRFSMGPEYFSVPRLGPREADVLRLVAGSAPMERAQLVEKIRRSLGVTRAMAYRWLESLREKGAIALKDSRVRPTPLGYAIASLLEAGASGARAAQG